jgi:hypothetical protein
MAQRIGKRILSAPVVLWRLLFDTYRRGGTMFVVAPLIVALIVVPEALQHVVEILIGLFRSHADAVRLSGDPRRMAFGYVKIAGLVVAMLATARFWHVGSVRRTLLIPPRDVLRLLLWIAGTMLMIEGLMRAGAAVGSAPLALAIDVVSTVLQLIATVMIVAALLGDRAMTVHRAVAISWRVVPVLLVLLVAAFGPSFLLHGLTHKIAIGAAAALVWVVMAIDALIVGLLAALTGSALYVSYAWATGLRRDDDGAGQTEADSPLVA